MTRADSFVRQVEGGVLEFADDLLVGIGKGTLCSILAFLCRRRVLDLNLL